MFQSTLLCYSLTSASEFKWHGKVYGHMVVLMDTLRATMKQFEEAIPLCFMHPHWSTLRSLWLKALNSCNNTTRFVTVLGLFQCNIKPVLFNSVWNDSLGKSLSLYFLLSLFASALPAYYIIWEDRIHVSQSIGRTLSLKQITVQSS